MIEIYYHGSSALFHNFDLEHALEGAAKVKFGYGVYVTSAYSSAAHYSAAHPGALTHYVYTVEVPEKKSDNFIAFKQPVLDTIVKRAEAKLSVAIPQKAKEDGKEFRKFLATTLSGKKKIDLAAEKAASQFLLSIGVDFIEWPYNWKNPAAESNRAILSDESIHISKVEIVEVDEKKHFIEGSNRPAI